MAFYSGSAAAALPVLAGIAVPSPSSHIRTSRVSQLDTSLLDGELLNILSAPLRPSAEVLLALKAGLLYLGLSGQGASYGARLQNLVFAGLRNRRATAVAYVVLATLPEYAHAKARDAMLVNGWPDYPSPPGGLWTLVPGRRTQSSNTARRKRELRRLAWDTLLRFEKVWATAKLVNLLLFLHGGRYPTLLARLLKLRYTYLQKSVARNVSFDYLNRQLVWEAFTEFLLFMMPLVDMQSVRRAIKRLVNRHAPAWLTLGGRASAASVRDRKPHDGTAGADKRQRKGPLSHLPPSVCPICHSRSSMPTHPDPSAHVVDPTDPTTSTAFLSSLTKDAHNAGQECTVPYVTDCCGGQYCYYCIASRICEWEAAVAEREREGETMTEQDLRGWRCLRCDGPVTSIDRYLGDDEGYADRLDGQLEDSQDEEVQG